MSQLLDRVDKYSIAWLTLAWVLLWGDLTLLNVVSGVLVATLLCVLYPMPKLQVPITFRPIRFVTLLVVFLRDLVTASVHVALVVLRPGEIGGGSLIEVPLRSREQFFVTTTAGMTTLVPGSVVIDIDRVTGTLLLHCLHVFTEEDKLAFRDQVWAQERRLLLALDKHCDRSLAGPVGAPMHEPDISPETEEER